MNWGSGQQVAHRCAVGCAHELHRPLGQRARLELVGEHAVQCPVGVDCLLAATKDHRVATLEAKRRGVDGHVRAALVDHEDHAQRNADLADFEPIGAAAGADRFADRIGQRGDLRQRTRHLVDTLGRERQPVDRGGIETMCRGRGDVSGVGVQDLRAARAERIG